MIEDDSGLGRFVRKSKQVVQLANSPTATEKDSRMLALEGLEVAIRLGGPADVDGQFGQAEQGIVFEKGPARMCSDPGPYSNSQSKPMSLWAGVAASRLRGLRRRAALQNASASAKALAILQPPGIFRLLPL